MSDKIVFRALNKHSGGTPPTITAGPGLYTGYFENEYGEQFIFVYDRKSGEATLYIGDAGWSAAPVVDGRVEDVELSEIEARWVSMCWSVAVGQIG